MMNSRYIEKDEEVRLEQRWKTNAYEQGLVCDCCGEALDREEMVISGSSSRCSDCQARMSPERD